MAGTWLFPWRAGTYLASAIAPHLAASTKLPGIAAALPNALQSWPLLAGSISFTQEEKKHVSTSSNQHLNQIHDKDVTHEHKPLPLHGILRFLPPRAVPYAQLMRLEKPIGTWLLAWPCFWSIALAADPGHLPDMRLLALFGAGAVLLRGAGCTVNDLWDRELDKKVERTRSRPLASGALQPIHAIAFLALQLSLGLCILLQLNDYSKIMGATSLLLVGTYPLFKRFTYWPQAYLGLTINWGAMMGYAAAHGSCDWGIVLPLYIGAAFWTLMYDTIYAHQDTKDDVQAGVKSTALRFGQDSKAWLSGFAACSTMAFLIAGAAADCSWPYYPCILGAAACMAWQIRTVNLNDGPDCMSKFVSNKWVGAVVFAGAVAGRLM